ncbi:MAG: patatin-like phospholipase family protein [Anaerolineales bacterium]|nr:MAG: patatin-like phospholipase family protein [Anaerolineales bacterium]
MEKKIALALGGGGVKGVSHIGVLRRLEQHGFQIHAIAGTSIGAIVGVFYALGYKPDEIEKLFVEFKQTRLYGQLKGQEPSLLGLAGFTRRVNELIGNRTFADLKIPLIMTATWVEYGREVFLDQGSLVDALLASMALPGIFPMKYINRMGLVDGGMINPVPVEAVRTLAEPNMPIVAIPLTAPLGVPASMERIIFPKFVPRWLGEWVKRTRLVRAADVFFLTQDMMNRANTKHYLDISKPDLIIRPAVAHLNTLEKVDMRAVAKKGDEAIDAALPELNKLFEEKPVTQ